VLPLVLDWAAALGAALARAPGRDAASTHVRCVPPDASLDYTPAAIHGPWKSRWQLDTSATFMQDPRLSSRLQWHLSLEWA
jgi:hypothetical protein